MKTSGVAWGADLESKPKHTINKSQAVGHPWGLPDSLLSKDVCHSRIGRWALKL